MLDVHAPHETVHGWRDFFIHLATITIGLLIALGLEGCVEWMHHRHLVQEAEASLHREIENNSTVLVEAVANLQKEQKDLGHDVEVLKEIIKTKKPPTKGNMAISVTFQGFESVSWKTAESTGAFAYMPYPLAREYSDIYAQQEQIDIATRQAVRDAIISLGPFLNKTKEDPLPGPEEAAQIKQHIEVLQGQMLLVDSQIKVLGDQYKRFLAAHPE